MSHQIHYNTGIDVLVLVLPLKEEALQSAKIQLQSIFGILPFEFIRNLW